MTENVTDLDVNEYADNDDTKHVKHEHKRQKLIKVSIQVYTVLVYKPVLSFLL